jgi:hypothetical protein
MKGLLFLCYAMCYGYVFLERVLSQGFIIWRLIALGSRLIILLHSGFEKFSVSRCRSRCLTARFRLSEFGYQGLAIRVWLIRVWLSGFGYQGLATRDRKPSRTGMAYASDRAIAVFVAWFSTFPVTLVTTPCWIPGYRRSQKTRYTP